MMLAERLIPHNSPIMPREQRMMPRAKATAKMLDFVIAVVFEGLIVETAASTPQAIPESDALHRVQCCNTCREPFPRLFVSVFPADSHEPAGLNLTIKLCSIYISMSMCPRRCRCVPAPPKAAGGCMLSECQRCAAALRQLLWLVTWPQHARGAFCPLGEGYPPSSTLLAQSLCVFACAPRCQCALVAVLAVASLSGWRYPNSGAIRGLKTACGYPSD